MMDCVKDKKARRRLKTLVRKCDICQVNVSGEKNFISHVNGKKHRLNLKWCEVGDKLEIQSDLSAPAVVIDQIEEPELVPGEPITPGLEDSTFSVSQIQLELDSHTSSPLIGLEYLAEATVEHDPSKLEYFCLLCDRKGPRPIVICHLTSIQHQLKYMGKVFPSVHNYLVPLLSDPNSRQFVMKIVNGVAAKIEREFGRMKPLVLEKHVLLENKKYYCTKISEEKRQWDVSKVSLNDIVRGMVRGERGRNFKDKHLMELGKIRMADEKDGNSEDKVLRILSREEINEGAIKQLECVGKSGVMESLMAVESKDSNINVTEFSPNDETCADNLLAISNSPDRSSLLSFRSLSPAFRRHQRSPTHCYKSERTHPVHISDINAYHPQRRRIRSRSNSQLKSRSTSRSTTRSRCGSVSWQRVRSNSRTPIRESCPVTEEENSNFQSLKRQNDYSCPRRRSPCDKKRPGTRGSEISGTTLKKNVGERSVWDQFHFEADSLETNLVATLQRYERSPERHPLYAAEWKSFYSSQMRDKTIKNSHELKEEWITHWGKRMHELHSQEFLQKKDAIRKRLGLPEEPEPVPSLHFVKKRKIGHGISFSQVDDDWIPPAPAKLADRASSPTIPSPPSLASAGKLLAISDHKETWKNITESDIHCEQSKFDSPRDNIIPTLRLVSALEDQLGSLGPMINYYLSYVLTLQRSDPSLTSLMITPDTIALFEMVKEKLIGQLETGIVRRALVSAVESTVAAISSLLVSISLHRIPIQSTKVDSYLKSEMRGLTSAAILSGCVKSSIHGPSQAPDSLPLAIPGVGEVDKVAVAQQIALALIAKGKTDVTQTELQTLVEEIIGLAQARSELNFKQSDTSAVSKPTSGDDSLKNLMMLVCDHFRTSDCANITSKTSRVSKQRKYSLIKVDLEENACKKSYQAQSMKCYLSGVKERVMNEEKCSSTNGKSSSLRPLRWDFNENGIHCIATGSLQLSKEDGVVSWTNSRNPVADHIVNDSRLSFFSPHGSFHGVNSNQEQAAHLQEVEKECETRKSDFSDSRHLKPLNYGGVCNQRTSRVYNDSESLSGFRRRPDGAIVGPVMSYKDPRNIDPRSKDSCHKRLPAPHEHFKADYLGKEERQFQDYTGHQSRFQSLSLRSGNPIERASHEPDMASPRLNSPNNLAYNYNGSDIPCDGFSQPISIARHSDLDVQDHHSHQKNFGFYDETNQFKYSREGTRYSDVDYFHN